MLVAYRRRSFALPVNVGLFVQDQSRRIYSIAKMVRHTEMIAKSWARNECGRSGIVETTTAIVLARIKMARKYLTNRAVRSSFG
jgi:hypothetical protein